MDVKSAFHAVLAKTKTYSIAEFSTWPLLHQFETSRDGYGSDILVKPDGFIRIHEKEEGSPGFAHDFFLEVDRSTETQDTLVSRAEAYLAYYRSGGFAVRNGASRDRFKEYPFRVLMVLKSAERRNNMAARLAGNTPPILTMVWLTTLAEATANPLGAIWVQPKDYREVIKGTRFETRSMVPVFEYRRQVEREAFVEAKVRKLTLFV